MTVKTHFYETFNPKDYDLYLDIDRQKKTINGVTKIVGEALETTILLHQKDLTITKVTLNDTPVTFSVDNTKDALIISNVTPGKITLEITYSAPLTDTMMGIYPSYYQVDGQTKQLVGTQFETTAARQAFVCVDEPEAKATFKLALKFDEQPGEIALSNMPEEKVSEGVHYFERTVKMSTYLVAFVFGELQGKYTTTTSGVKIGVFATKAHAATNLAFALDIAKRSIEFYENYYQTPYPLPHSWQVALPDFSAGAMENWGLVTYREVYLLLDQDNTTLANKQRVATVIAHELAHQWFGDLVTMKWWDDLWLNESFANMMEYVAIDKLAPELDIWKAFQTSEVPLALNRDATAGVQSIYTPVKDPGEIDALFDGAIVYAKGARMLVMVRSLIGDDALRLGLKNYFKQHQYGNATGDDLWSALGKVANIDLKAIMESWLTQPGYPVVKAKLVNNELILEQQRFFKSENEHSEQLWQIPLKSNYPELPALMTTKKLVIPNYQELRAKNKQPLRLNVGNDVHFIVDYDQNLRQDLLAHLAELDDIAIFAFLQDLHLLAQAQQISYAQIVALLPEITNPTTSNLINTALFAVANDLKRFVTTDTNAKKNLEKLYDMLSANQLEKLGYEAKPNDSFDQKMSRPIILVAALYAKNKALMSSLHQLFVASNGSWVSLAADIRSVCLKNEILNFNTPETFAHLWKEYQTTTDASYKADLLNALTSSQDETQLTQLVKAFTATDVIKPQDLRAWFSAILANPQGQQLAWDWMRQNWDWLEQTVGGDMEFPTYVSVVAKAFDQPQRLAEFKAFFEPKKADSALTREIDMGLNTIASRVELLTKQHTAVKEALASL